jgi:hypothetical protein
MNRAERKLLRENFIEAAGKPLGRPSKKMQTTEYRQYLSIVILLNPIAY